MQERIDRYSIPEPNSGCVLWMGATIRGYPVIRYKGKVEYVSRLVAGIPKGVVGRHKCDVALCINENHIIAGTQADNMADMVQRRRQSRGSHRPLSKLTEDQVLQIRNDSGKQYEIARAYRISQSTVSQIKSRQRWGWL